MWRYFFIQYKTVIFFYNWLNEYYFQRQREYSYDQRVLFFRLSTYFQDLCCFETNEPTPKLRNIWKTPFSIKILDWGSTLSPFYKNKNSSIIVRADSKHKNDFGIIFNNFFASPRPLRFTNLRNFVTEMSSYIVYTQ